MIVFVVSFISPHTLPIGIELAKDEKVVFINTIKLTDERKRMGYKIEDSAVEILEYDACPQRCNHLINEANVVIFACAKLELLTERINSGKLVFLLHERIFKKGFIKWLDIRTHRLAKFCRKVRRKNVYLLSIGDYAAKDFSHLGFNKTKIYRFGYFPRVEEVAGSKLIGAPKSIRIIWVGRMVDVKRPLMALKAYKRLPNTFSLCMVGDGALFGKVRKYVIKNRLQVSFLGHVTNDTVRREMLNSDILLSTSGRGEGWGAVINEGMNNGCAIVCSKDIGCAYTLADENTAVLYDTHSIKSLRAALLEAAERRVELGKKALQKIQDEYNCEEAARRLNLLIRNIGDEDILFESGICSLVYPQDKTK